MGIIIVGVIILLLSSTLFARSRLMLNLPYRDIILRHSSLNNLDPCLVAAVIKVESNFKFDALRIEPHISDASIGLMQVLVTTANDVIPGTTSNDLMVPEINIMIGTKYLAFLRDRFKAEYPADVDMYNVGPGNFQKGRRSSAYVGKVLNAIKDVCP